MKSVNTNCRMYEKKDSLSHLWKGRCIWMNYSHLHKASWRCSSLDNIYFVHKVSLTLVYNNRHQNNETVVLLESLSIVNFLFNINVVQDLLIGVKQASFKIKGLFLCCNFQDKKKYMFYVQFMNNNKRIKSCLKFHLIDLLFHKVDRIGCIILNRNKV